jgi:hypothetical protein
LSSISLFRSCDGIGQRETDMTRDEWLQQFEDELIKLRPHLSGGKVAYTLALQAYTEIEHPRVAAREYHKRQQPSASSTAKKNRR